jgi:hypothetical protein
MQVSVQFVRVPLTLFAMIVALLFWGHSAQGQDVDGQNGSSSELPAALNTDSPDPLPSAFAEFLQTLSRVEVEMRNSPFYGTEAERVATYQHLLRMMLPTIEEDVIQSKDFPYFRKNDFWIREGGDNPDQVYSIANIHGGETYRIWGKLGSAKRIEVQLNRGRPWFGTGESIGYLAFENIGLDEDGSFEILLSPEKRPGNWLANPERADIVYVRQIYDRWGNEGPAEVHIDKVGHEGAEFHRKSAAELAEQLRTAAFSLEQFTLGWEKFVDNYYASGIGPNRISPLKDTFSKGGVRGRWMSTGHFDLPEGKAFLIRAPKTSAAHMGIQLTDMWFASLEYANQTSSLNATQSLLSDDNAYYYVISRTDPGHANWLDSGDLGRGVILMRYDGAMGDIPESLHPIGELVDLDEISDRIPGFTPVSESDRAAVRASRRRHLQLRSTR